MLAGGGWRLEQERTSKCTKACFVHCRKRTKPVFVQCSKGTKPAMLHLTSPAPIPRLWLKR
jgi:hypothetical protein